MANECRYQVFFLIPKKYHQCASDCSLGEMAGVAKGTCRCGLEDQVQCDLGRLLQVLRCRNTCWMGIALGNRVVDLKEGQLSNDAETLVVEFGHGPC